MSGLSTFAWGIIVGYAFAKVLEVVGVWRRAKAKVNEARRRHGLEPEKRWWRL